MLPSLHVGSGRFAGLVILVYPGALAHFSRLLPTDPTNSISLDKIFH